MDKLRTRLSREGIEKVYVGRLRKESSRSGFLDGNTVKLLHSGTQNYSESGPETLKRILNAIYSARHTICLQFYIFRNDETGTTLAKALKAKASQGVSVYLIHDHLGSFSTPRPFWDDLRSAGIRVAASHPFSLKAPLSYEHRDHRKLIIIDSSAVFAGGLNIANEYLGSRARNIKPWRDTGVFVHGPAAEKFMQSFRRSWHSWTKEKIPTPTARDTKDTRDKENMGQKGTLPVLPIITQRGRIRRRMRKLLRFSIRNADSDICLTTAYFIPGRRIIRELALAVSRGVRVRLLVPNVSDVISAHFAGRYFFSRLLKTGIEIYTYRDTMLHAKTYVFDQTWSIVGSANLDQRSMWLNDEGNVGIFDQGFGQEMAGVFKDDLKNSDRLFLNNWKQRPLWEKMLEWLFSRLRRRL